MSISMQITGGPKEVLKVKGHGGQNGSGSLDRKSWEMLPEKKVIGEGSLEVSEQWTREPRGAKGC